MAFERRRPFDEYTASRVIRGAVGAFIPLAISLETGHLSQGLWVFMGVLLLLQVEKPLPYLARIRYALTTATIGIFGFVIGALVPGSGVSTVRDIILILAMGLVSFAVGYMSGFDMAWSSGAATLLMLASTSMDNDAVETHWNAALWFALGVGIYIAMLVIEWLLLRDAPERQAMGEALSALERYADAVEEATADGPTSPLAPLPISPTLADPVTKARREVYAATTQARKLTSVSRWGKKAAVMLDAVGMETAKVTSARFLPANLSATSPKQIAQNARAEEILVASRKKLPAPPASDAPKVEFRARQIWEFILHPKKDNVMGALRLSLAMATAVAVHRVVGTPHSYWIVVTVALIMRTNAGSAYARALERTLGAIGGLGIGWAVFQFVPKGWPQAIAIIVLMAITPLLKRDVPVTQQATFTALILVFTNLILPGSVSVNYGPERLEATAIGAAIVVLIGYAIWPKSREGRIIPLAKTARKKVAKMLRFESGISAEPLDEGDEPVATDQQPPPLWPDDDAYKTLLTEDPPDELTTLRQEARRAESALRHQLARGLTEPSIVSAQAAMWTPSSAALERLVDLATAAEWLPASDSKSSALARAAEAVHPGPVKNPVPHNRPVAKLPAAPSEAEAELLRSMVVLASSLETLTPPGHLAKAALKGVENIQGAV